ncbi:MAG: hypothetical protein RIT45_531, partial [Pseudomonadota bacterium]
MICACAGVDATVALSLALGCSGGESGTQSGVDAAANTDGNGAAGSFCGGPCKADDDCPDEGYACVDVFDDDVGKVVKQCKRKSESDGVPGQCTCAPARASR